MVTRQTSRLELNPISPFAVVAPVATTLGAKAELKQRGDSYIRPKAVKVEIEK